MKVFEKNLQYYKFCFYGFFKNLKFFEPFLMLFFLSKDITYVQIGALYALKEISIYILEIPTGVFADVLGRRKTMMTSFLAYIISFVIFYMSDSFAILLLGMFAFSLGDALRTGTHKAMIFDYLKLNHWQSHKVLYYGHTRSWSQFGSALSSIIAALIVILSRNYQIIFLVSILPYLLNLILVWSYPSSLDGPIKNSKQINFKDSITELLKYSKQSAKSFQLTRTLINMASFQGYFKSIKDYLQPIVLISIGAVVTNEVQDPDTKSTIVIGVVYFVIYLISSFTSRKSNFFVQLLKSNERVMNYTLIIGFLIGLLSGIFIQNSLAKLAVIFFVFIFVIQNIRKPVGSVLLSEKVDNEIMATALSVQSLFDSLFASFLALSIGLLADFFSIGLALSIIGSVLLVISPFLTLKTKVIIQKEGFSAE